MTRTLIYGRDAELEQVRNLVSGRNSFLLYGPAGVGKTLLLTRLIEEIGDMLYCEESSSGQSVFRRLLTELFAKKSDFTLHALGRGGPDAIRSKSAVSARGIVAEALGEREYWIVLDHLKSPSQSFASAVKDVCCWSKTPLLAVARSAHMEDVGFLLPMFPGRSEKYELRNFDSSAARKFALRTAQEVQLQAANREDVLEKIVHYSKGNPGAIRTMLQMAVNPKYVIQQHVKLSPLYIDFRLQWET